MEDDHYSIVVSIGKDILVHLHRLLFVATYEIDLNTLYTSLFHPCHLLTTSYHAMHLATRSLHGVVPIAVGVVPKEELYALCLCISSKFLDALITDVCIPPCVNEEIFPTHCCGEVNILFLLVVVTACVHTYDPAPCRTSVLILLRCLVLWLHKVPLDCCLCQRGESGANGDCAPRQRCCRL